MLTIRTFKLIHAVLLFSAIALFMVSKSFGAEQGENFDQENTNLSSNEVPKAADALGRAHPRGAVIGFLAAAEANDFELAAQYLDLRNISDEAANLGGPGLARRLDIVMQRSGWVDVDGLSDHPEGMTGDNLPSYREMLTRLRRGDQEFVLLLQRVPGGEGQFVWKVSNATVSKIPELYSVFGYGAGIETIAELTPEGSFFGVSLFKWVIILGVGLLSAPVLWGIGWILGRKLPIKNPGVRERITKFLTRPLMLLFVVIFMRWTFEYLGLGVSGQKITASWTLITIVAVWVLIALVSLFRDIFSLKLAAKGRPDAVVLLKPLMTTIKTIIIILAFMLWLDNIGVNITTLLAGLGVGGIAIALALQRPAEDFLAALGLFTQQQVKVGDFCRFGNQVGTIEEIGLRTTRLRTLANTVVALPNARFAAEYIENISAREKILYNPTIRIDYETSRKVLEAVLKNIRTMLGKDANVAEEGLRVRYREMSLYSHDIEIFAYIEKTEWTEFLEITESLNLDVLDAVEKANAKLAVPIQKIKMESSKLK
ncbi:MAG: mechanosensitive ion channel family protein [Sphingomonadales bacterium]